MHNYCLEGREIGSINHSVYKYDFNSNNISSSCINVSFHVWSLVSTLMWVTKKQSVSTLCMYVKAELSGSLQTQAASVLCINLGTSVPQIWNSQCQSYWNRFPACLPLLQNHCEGVNIPLSENVYSFTEFLI